MRASSLRAIGSTPIVLPLRERTGFWGAPYMAIKVAGALSVSLRGPGRGVPTQPARRRHVVLSSAGRTNPIRAPTDIRNPLICKGDKLQSTKSALAHHLLIRLKRLTFCLFWTKGVHSPQILFLTSTPATH